MVHLIAIVSRVEQPLVQILVKITKVYGAIVNGILVSLADADGLEMSAN